jgi:hypothetical protein
LREGTGRSREKDREGTARDARPDPLSSTHVWLLSDQRSAFSRAKRRRRTAGPPGRYDEAAELDEEERKERDRQEEDDDRESARLDTPTRKIDATTDGT